MMLLPEFPVGFVQAFEECREFFLVETQVDKLMLDNKVFLFAVKPNPRNCAVGGLFSRQVVNRHCTSPLGFL
jgi:hypothetical protein